MPIELNKIYCENCLVTMGNMPDNFINCCVTSPPYYGLRDYGHPDQIGLEESPELYVKRLVSVFSELKRVLKKDGTLWLNLGDSYYNTSQGSGSNSKKQLSNYGSRFNIRKVKYKNIKPKDLIGIPWMVAFALRADGWYLRQDIIWSKPNPMPESVTDRCTKAHEYIFLLSKSAKYYYDQDSIKNPVADATILRLSQQIEKQKGSERIPNKSNGNMKAVGEGRNPRQGIDTKGGNQGSIKGIPPMAINGNGVTGHSGYFDSCGNLIGEGMANKRSVWEVCTMPFKEAHFATFPEDLIIPCIKAGCPEGGIVYDPFSGAGTTALVSYKLNRKFIGSEISQEYVELANKRLDPYLRQKTFEF
jgi:DNA modification methylase